MSINYKKQEEEVLAISYALKILKVWFKEIPDIEGILYIDWVPEAVRTLLKDQIEYRQISLPNWSPKKWVQLRSAKPGVWKVLPTRRSLPPLHLNENTDRAKLQKE